MESDESMAPALDNPFGFNPAPQPSPRDWQRIMGERLQAQSEAVRFILYLQWFRWLHTSDRNERTRKQ